MSIRFLMHFLVFSQRATFASFAAMNAPGSMTEVAGEEKSGLGVSQVCSPATIENKAREDESHTDG